MTSTDSNLIVRPYVARDDARLLALLRAVWAHKQDVETHLRRRWWWQWDPPPLLVVDDCEHDLLAGLCAYVPFALRTGGIEHRSAWFVDFYVRPEYQGRGLGQRLTQAVQDEHDITASLSQTAMAYRVFQKLGWSTRSPVPLLVHPLPRSWMFRHQSRHDQIATGAVDSALPAWAGIDALWLRVRDRFPAIAVRDSAHLLARYAKCDGREYTLLSASRGSAPVGYMIVRVVDSASNPARPPHGLIVDYLVDPDDADSFGALLAEAGSALVGRGVNRIYALSTLPACQRVLRRRGFVSPSTPLLGRWVQGNTKWLTCKGLGEDSSAVASAWHLTLGDCDLDYAWSAG
ncbi:MAG: GNAT family N-acetyltransferase [Acidobacteriota bacterium]